MQSTAGCLLQYSERTIARIPASKRLPEFLRSKRSAARRMQAGMLVAVIVGAFRTAAEVVRGYTKKKCSKTLVVHHSRYGTAEETTSTFICCFRKKDLTASNDNCLLGVGPTTTRSIKSQRHRLDQPNCDGHITQIG
jgi:hypothetical protein